MKRRQAIFGIVGLGVGLLAAREVGAQPAGRVPVIGLLDAGDRLQWWAVFRQELRGLGYVEGRNVAYEMRLSGGQFEPLSTLTQELIRIKVAVIVTSGTVAAQAGKQATSTIPIVMATGDDPVKLG